MKKYILLSLLLCISFAGLSAQGDYTRVKNYSVKMNVHSDNTYDVVEKITAHFAEPHHGIYRYVPYAYGMFSKKYYLKIADVDVENEPYTLDDENENVLIKIGDAEKVITGDRNYTIRYSILNRDDRVSSCDVFYHSIIGSDFQLPIDSLSFVITFDKKLPVYASDSLEIYSGPAELTENKLNAMAWISGNTISGYAVKIPNANAVTVRLPLPEGFYVGEDSISPLLAYIFLVITVLLLIVIFHYEFTVVHPGITKQIEFYPPDDMCSAEVGTVIDGSVDKVDLASLIPWFASKGYIKIDEVEDRGLFVKSKHLELTKLKSLPSDTPVYQANFFRALFRESNTVRLDKMPNVAEDIQSASDALKDIYKGNKKLTSWHWSVYLLFPLMIVSTCFLIASLPFKFMESSDQFFVYSLWLVPFIIGILWVTASSTGSLFRKVWVRNVSIAVRFLSIVVLTGLYITILDDQQVDYMLIVAVYILCFIAVECCVRLEINSKYRADLIGKLLGLKEFIETAEEPRLRSLLEDDPKYFYRILPYAMVFGTSDIWADNFKNIEMEAPEWYNGTGTMFMTDNFVSSLSSATNNAIQCMAPSTSSSGGGGFSGGGTGGGGGGAW